MAACACPARPVDDIGFLEDYADFVQAPSRMRNSLASPQSIAPAALFAGAALLQIDDADVKLQEEIGDRGGTPWAADAGEAAMIGTAVFLPLLAPSPREGTRAWTVALSNVEALAWTSALTHAIKAMDLRTRPNGSSGSLPSGHTAASFAAARLLEREYGLAVGVPAYALASFVGYERVRTDSHYPADVLVGAGLGLLVANLIHDKNLGDEGYYRRRFRVEVAPVIGEDTIGLTVGFRW
jgi:membrane-associated phospholipid phosphatase